MNTQHYFSKHHLWIQLNQDGTCDAGISEHAQQMLGDIVYVEAPAIGQHIVAEQTCGIVESVKTASDLHAPVSGTVIATNENVLNSPELLDDAPEEHWIFRIRADNTEDIKTLMDKAAYEAFVA